MVPRSEDSTLWSCCCWGSKLCLMSDWQLTKGKVWFIYSRAPNQNLLVSFMVIKCVKHCRHLIWTSSRACSVIFHLKFLHHYRLRRTKTLIFPSIQDCIVTRSSEKFELLFRILLKIPVIRSWILGAKSLQSFLEISQEHTRIFQRDRKTNQIDLRQTFF